LDSFTNSIRYALLALVFCAVTAVELAHAKFALLTNSELHAYWMGRYGQFPFTVLPWSERHLGGNVLAMRMPLLVIFALLLAVVLLGLERMVLRKIPVMTLTVVLVIVLFALGVQQVFALKKLRAERRAFFALRDRLERAAAPGEIVVVETNLAMPLYTYGSNALQQQLRAFLGSFPNIPPVKNLALEETGGEIIYVGSAQDALGGYLLKPGCSIRAYQPAQPKESELVAQYYRTPGTGIYFVSPPTREVNLAVSSKP
jgi:hypothetical protein